MSTLHNSRKVSLFSLLFRHSSQAFSLCIFFHRSCILLYWISGNSGVPGLSQAGFCGGRDFRQTKLYVGRGLAPAGFCFSANDMGVRLNERSPLSNAASGDGGRVRYVEGIPNPKSRRLLPPLRGPPSSRRKALVECEHRLKPRDGAKILIHCRDRASGQQVASLSTMRTNIWRHTKPHHIL